MKNLPAHCSFCKVPTLKVRWLLVVMISVTGFALIELWVGQISHSLALRADSGHMFADGLAMGIALIAAVVAQRSQPATRGNHRLELLAALINSLALLSMALWIGREAWSHWHGQPTTILSLPMLGTACIGLVINALNLYWLHGDVRQDLNVRGVFFHVLADLLGSVGAILAAIAVTFLQWLWADKVIGSVVAVAIALSALSLLWHSMVRLLATRHSLTEYSTPQMQAIGWLEVGHTDLSQLISKHPVDSSP